MDAETRGHGDAVMEDEKDKTADSASVPASPRPRVPTSIHPMTANPHCRLRLLCQACRDLHGGRELRRQWGLRWELPGGDVDFPCVDTADPRPWAWRPEGAAPGTIAVPEGAVAACRGCEALKACRAVVLCNTCGGAEPTIVAPCPQGRW